jgi:hypothetical protein
LQLLQARQALLQPGAPLPPLLPLSLPAHHLPVWHALLQPHPRSLVRPLLPLLLLLLLLVLAGLLLPCPRLPPFLLLAQQLPVL